MPDNDLSIADLNEAVKFIDERFGAKAIVSTDTSTKAEKNLARIKLSLKQQKYKTIEPHDTLYPYALDILLTEQKLTAFRLQRVFSIGYARAIRLKEIIIDDFVVDGKPDTQKITNALKAFSKD